jgi:DNA-binding response OmpR family regulator
MSEGKCILVIDDEEVVHASIKRILCRLNHEVTWAFTAQKGLKEMEQNRYDAVIADLLMPEMNGLDMLEEMKERNIKVPSIMITGYPTITSAIQALRLGAVDYIPKPFTSQELLSPLNRILRRRAATAEEITAASEKKRGSSKTEPSIQAGDCFYLPEHSWAVYNQEGTLEIGIDPSFLSSIPKINEIECPCENDLVGQGFPGIKIKASGEIHSVFMPLSGKVTAVNEKAVKKPESLNTETWLLKIVPSQRDEEIEWLRTSHR